MSRKLLSLTDLYEFYCKQNKSVKFSATDTDTSIVVHIEEPFVFEANESEDNDQLRVNLRLCHSQRNLNSSFIDDDVLEKAIPSAYNMPILGYIWKDDDGVSHFAGHEFYINEDGEYVYEEIPVGCIPESADLKLVQYDDDKKYLEGQGCIWKEYSDAADILEREKNLSVSVELEIRDLAFNAKDKVMVINDFIFTAVTILESNPETGEEIRPGMANSCISIDSLEDFSKKENSMFSQEIVQKLDELKEKLDDLSNFEIDIKPKKKGGEKVSKFEELLKKYDKTEEDITFEYEGMSDEELEAKFAEAFEESGEGEGADGTEPATDPTSDDSSEESAAKDDDASEEGGEESGEEGGEDAGAEAKFSKTFELSHSDIRVGLYALLAPFDEADNEWYGIVDVYDDYFIYQGWCDASHLFKQSYTKNGDVIEFSGDRIHMNAEFLTDNELAELNAMRSNYSEISEKLAKYEAEPQKVEKIQSEEYSMIRDTEEFKKIESEHFDLSVEQIGEELDKIVLSYAKAGKVNFAKNEEPKETVGRKVFGINTGKTQSRYGSLFNKDK